MGTSGTSIFADDVAMDVRDTWTDHLRQTADPAKATRKTLAEYKRDLKDSDDGPVIWLALALTQWKRGFPDKDVIDRAIQIIDSGEGLDRWREQGERLLKARLKVYAQTRETLLSPAPTPKPLKRPKPGSKEDSGFRPGDIIAIDLHQGGVAYLKVVGEDKDKDGRYPQVVLLDVPQDLAKPPAQWDAMPRIKFRNHGSDDGEFRYDMKVVDCWRRRDTPHASIRKVGSATVTAEEQRLGRQMFRYSSTWNDLRYELVYSLDRTKWPKMEERIEWVRSIPEMDLQPRRPEIISQLRRYTSHPYTGNTLVIGLLRAGDFRRALFIAEIMRDLFPDDPLSWFNVGRAHFAGGDTKNAETVWTQGLERAPKGERKLFLKWVEQTRSKNA